jgi:predicted small lipoprotein YifL
VKPGLPKWISLLVLLVVIASCGKKGPPKWVEPEKPAAPTALTVLQRYHPRQAVLGWEHEGSVEKFDVMRAGDGEFERIASVKERRYIDSGLGEGLTYRYRVVALSDRGIESDATGPVELTPVPGTQKPIDLSASIGHDAVALGWRYPHLRKTPRFNVYRREEGSQYPMAPVNALPVERTEFRDGTNAETVVYYSVRAFFPGDVATEGPTSDEVRVAPGDYVPSRPVGVDFAVMENRVLVFWKENPEAWVRGYGVYRAGGDGGFRRIGVTTTPAYEDRDLSMGKMYYRIKALGPVGESPYSDTVGVAPRP